MNDARKVAWIGRMRDVLARKREALVSDLRHGGLTGGLKRSPFRALGAVDTVSTDRTLLPLLLGPVLRNGDVFVDVGCGRGRVINWVLDDARASAVYGIELDKRIASKVAARLGFRLDVTIIAGDALTSLPDSATLFYLWHPFEAAIMARFKDVLISKYERLNTLRDIRIVYHNCLNVGVWVEEDRCVVTPIDLPVRTRHRAVLITFPGG